MTNGEMIEQAKEIVATGCGCDRQCEQFVGPDVYCGCRKDAEAVIALVRANGEQPRKEG